MFENNRTSQNITFVNGKAIVKLKLDEQLTRENNPRFPAFNSLSLVGYVFHDKAASYIMIGTMIYQK